MGLFSNLFGGKKAPKVPATELELPITREFREGKLKVHIDYHQLSHIPDAEGLCLIYRTEGMNFAGHKELVVVQRNLGEGYTELSEGLIQFFDKAYEFALNGQKVDVGLTTEFGGPIWANYYGFMYVEPEVQLLQPHSAPTLQMIFLTQKEIRAVHYFGHLRIQTMLGDTYHYFPTPCWSDRHRPELPIDRMAGESIVGRIDRTFLRGGSVVKTGESVRVRAPRGFQPELPDGIDPAESPVAILPDLAHDADACLAFTFDPKSMGPPAIAPAGSTGQCVSACVLIVLAIGEKLEIRHFEDGLNVSMPAAQHNAFWDALKSGSPFGISGEKGESFILEWI